MNNSFFYAVISGFTISIFLSSFFKLGFSFFIFLTIISFLIFIWGKYFSPNSFKVILLAIFIFSFSLGILRYEIKEARIENKNLENLVGEKIILRGIISAEPSLKENIVQLILAGDLVSAFNKDYVIKEQILVSAGLFPGFKYGDSVSVSGVLDKPANFSTENGNDFDYINFLAKEDIFYVLNFAQVELVSSGHGSFLKTKLFLIKELFVAKINFLIKEPESSLLGGLLLGSKNSLGKELQEDFRLAGVSHIVALSGYNITIVAESIMFGLSFLPRFLSLTGGVFGIIFFAIMTGGSATVMRASIMALLVLLARSTNRRYDISRALFLAGFFMLLQNPKILVFDISFQLSFLATIALILVSPLVENKMTFVTKKYHLRELIVATISTQIFVLPFLLFKMGLLSVFSLFANVLILPVIPLIMLLGFITGLLGFISLFLAIPVAFICSLLLFYILKIIYIFSHLPLSSLTIKNFPFYLTVLIYLIFFGIIWQLKRNSLRRVSL
jgi:competence protein ComEC